jgi:aryl-phospho-beta-D-glucosidase BglC (GH1 family)
MFFLAGCTNNPPISSHKPDSDFSGTIDSENNKPLNIDKNSFAGTNGKLQVIGNQLCNEKKEPIQLIGISSMHLHLFGRFVNKDTLKWLRDDWGITVFRAAMYTEEGGYIQNKSVKEKVKEAVEAATELGIYVIIDWHILSDGDPNEHIDEAKEFFREMSGLYRHYPNVIYEICNEPNGDDVNWSNSIKPYAQEIIPIIREVSPDSIIIVGTAHYSQDVNEAADDPLEFNNILYALHFYAGTHGTILREKIDYALEKGAAIFVSEWGTSTSTGSDGIFLKESIEWLNYLDSKKISWVNWSLCDKNESSAALTFTAGTKGNWSDNDLTESGLFVKYTILGKPYYTLFCDGFETGIFTKGLISSGCTISNDTTYKGEFSVSIKNGDSLTKELNTSRFSDIEVHFAYRTIGFTDNDFLVVEGFDGSGWMELGKYSGNHDWTEKSIILPKTSSNNENFKLRFSTITDTQSSIFYLDELKITAKKE